MIVLSFKCNLFKIHVGSFCFWHKHQGPFVQCVDPHPRLATCSSFRIMAAWEEKGGGWWCDRSRDAYGGDFRAHCTNDGSRIPVIGKGFGRQIFPSVSWLFFRLLVFPFLNYAFFLSLNC